MNETNHNANSFPPESIFADNNCSSQPQSEVKVSAQIHDSNLFSEHLTEKTNYTIANNNHLEDSESITATMNWQKVAHKLREYNRKLLKKVFRLEQELAEIDNKFNKYVEKTRNSDSLLAQQAEELENYQEKVDLLMQQLANSQQQLENQELLVKQVSEQHQLSQQQAAQLERECTLLQEKYNQQAFDLVTKEQENRELQSELNQQETELKRYQEAALRKEKAVNRHQNYPHNRFIQPWSTSAIPEPRIALPKTKSQPSATKKTAPNTAQTIRTAAEIATWSASATSSKQTERAKTTRTSPPKQNNKKPQSLAAVDLPTFPRPQ